MKNKKFIIPTAILALFIMVIMTGSYPVAFVDGSPIFYHTWQKTEEAEKRFSNTQDKSLGVKPLDFSKPENLEMLKEVRRSTLTFLIENKIIEQAGGEVIADFKNISQKRMDTVMQEGGDLKTAVKTVYNLDVADFQNLILLPQSRRDVLKIFLANEGKSFDDWLAEQKKAKKIQLMFTPFTWDGEQAK